VRVLVIAEDYRQDQYLLLSLIKAVTVAAGIARAHIDFCRDPQFQGIAQILSGDLLARALDQHRGMIDLFLLCVDRDAEPTRHLRLETIEAQARETLRPGSVLFASQAEQELEVWALAGMRDLPGDWRWADLRAHRDPKESYFRPYIESRGLQNTLGSGRKQLGEEAARNYDRVKQLCPEVAELERRIREWNATRNRPTSP
jgi:hypothetical protein